MVFTITGVGADRPKSLCFKVGAVLRITDVEPGTVSGSPDQVVSCRYEAGIVECQFLQAGTATVAVGRGSNSFTTTVVVI